MAKKTVVLALLADFRQSDLRHVGTEEYVLSEFLDSDAGPFSSWQSIYFPKKTTSPTSLALEVILFYIIVYYGGCNSIRALSVDGILPILYCYIL